MVFLSFVLLSVVVVVSSFFSFSLGLMLSCLYFFRICPSIFWFVVSVSCFLSFVLKRFLLDALLLKPSVLF